MQISKWLVPAAAAALGCGIVAQSALADVILYDSHGFEASAGYVASPANVTLVGQPAGAGNDRWIGYGPPDGSGRTAGAAVLAAPTNPDPNNQQYVGVLASNLSTAEGDSALFTPGTHITDSTYGLTGLPYNATGQQIAIRVSMSYSASPTNPFIGLTAYDGIDPIGFGGVNAGTGKLEGITTNAAGTAFTAAPGVFYQYELLLDYANQQVSFFEAPADGVSPFVLMGTAPFLTATNQFTDIDLTISTFGSTSPSVSGLASFDNYSISLVPEPATLSMMALGLLCSYHRRRA